MNIAATNKRVSELITKMRDGVLIPDPEFQRRLVWQNKHKQAFIQTVLEGFPFPEIYIATGETDLATGNSTELLVDGQQRITTLYHYFIGSEELKLGRELPPYTELPEEQQRQFLQYQVVVRDLGSLDIEKIKEIFARINSTGYSLNAMELHNARYNGEFKDAGLKLSQHDIFEQNKVFAPSTVRRMNDLKYCLNLLITVMSAYTNRDDEIEEYLKIYNDEFTDKDIYLENVYKVLDFINSMEFDIKSRVWNQLDLFTLAVELYKILISERQVVDKVRLKQRLISFYSEVDSARNEESVSTEALEYFRAFNIQPNDRSSRIKRGEIISQILKESVQA